LLSSNPGQLTGGQRPVVQPDVAHAAVEVVVTAEADLQRLIRCQVELGRGELCGSGDQLSVHEELKLLPVPDGGNVLPAGGDFAVAGDVVAGFERQHVAGGEGAAVQLAVVDGHRPRPAVVDVGRHVEAAGAKPAVR